MNKNKIKKMNKRKYLLLEKVFIKSSKKMRERVHLIKACKLEVLCIMYTYSFS